MEENNRQRVSDNANEPLGEVDLTAVTSSNGEHQRSVVQGDSNKDLSLSTSVILTSHNDETSTDAYKNAVNYPSSGGDLGLVLENTVRGHTCNAIPIEGECILLNLDKLRSQVDTSETDNRPLAPSEPDVTQSLVRLCSNVNETITSSESCAISLGLGNDILKESENVLPSESVHLNSPEFSAVVKVNSTDTLLNKNVEKLLCDAPIVEDISLVEDTPVDPTEEAEESDCKDNEEMVAETNPGPVYNFDGQIQEITGAWEEFQSNKGECFTKGCKWSPDGTCLLTNSDDNVLRIFDLPTELHCQESWSSQKLPEMRPVLKMAEGGLIYDYCWYPLMSSWDPLSCCLVSTSQDNPVHLWDAFTGALRATYRAYNQVDEVEAASCVAFDRHGDKLYCGFKNVVRVFNTAIPGRNCETRYLKDANVAESQRGIVSCIAVNPASGNIYAVGSYLKSVGLYSEPRGSALCLMTGHAGGVTHLVFSPDGTKLFSGARKDADIICWDIRNPGHVLYTMERKVGTNQRIQFDVTPDGQYVVSGNSDGSASVWDLLEPPVSVESGCDPVLPIRQKFTAHKDCTNGVSIHQQYPILATSSGQRHFAELSRDMSDSDSDGSSPLLKRKYIQRENCVKLWWTGKVTPA